MTPRSYDREETFEELKIENEKDDPLGR